MPQYAHLVECPIAIPSHIAYILNRMHSAPVYFNHFFNLLYKVIKPIVTPIDNEIKLKIGFNIPNQCTKPEPKLVVNPISGCDAKTFKVSFISFLIHFHLIFVL